MSGSGQQHGSVYLAHGARDVLRKLDPAHRLASQLSGVFSLADSPIWADSSTTDQCRRLEAAMGGPHALAELTGSRYVCLVMLSRSPPVLCPDVRRRSAYERFTSNQIAKVAETQPQAWEKTEHVALVSSFMASLWLGQYAPIDYSDGAGMNLMDLFAAEWSPEACKATAPDLAGRLPRIVPSHAVVGNVSQYFCNACVDDGAGFRTSTR